MKFIANQHNQKMPKKKRKNHGKGFTSICPGVSKTLYLYYFTLFITYLCLFTISESLSLIPPAGKVT